MLILKRLQSTRLTEGLARSPVVAFVQGRNPLPRLRWTRPMIVRWLRTAALLGLAGCHVVAIQSCAASRPQAAVLYSPG